MSQPTSTSRRARPVARAAAPRHADGDVGDPTVTALRVLGIASLVLTLTTETVPLVLEFHAAEPTAAPGLALLLLSQLGALFALLLPRHSRVTPWVLLALLGGGIAEMMRHDGTFDAADLLLPGYWIFPLVAVSMRSKRRREYGLFALVAMLAMMVVQHVYVGSSTWEDLADHLWIIQPTLLVLLFGDAIISIDESRAEAVAASLEARNAHDGAEGAQQAQAAADRLLDDHVLTALGLVRRPGSRQRVVDACASAWRAVEGAAQRRRTIRIEDLLRDSEVVAANGAIVEGSTGPVPVAMATAFVSAVEATLTGGTRRAQRTQALVTVTAQDDERTVTVVDPRPARPARGRAARDNGIIAPMAEIGGDAVLATAASGEATTTLQWPRPEHRTGVAALREAPDQMVRAKLTRTVWPTLVTALVMTFLAGPTLERPTVGIATALVTLAVGALTAVVLRQRAMPRIGLLAVVATALVAWGVNLWLVPDSPDIDYPLWIAWAASALVHLVVLADRLLVGATLTVLWGATEVLTLAHAYGWAGAWDHSFLVITGAGDVLITLLVLWVARSAAAQQARATEVAGRLRAATTRQQMASSVRQYWGPSVTSRALPLLRGIADGSIDPTDRTVQDDVAQVLVDVQRERAQA